MKLVLGDAVALTERSKVTKQQSDDASVIRGRSELRLFYGAVCQGLQCMLHIATAFKTGIVQLDKNSTLGGYLGLVSDHYDDAVEAVGQATSRASDLAERVGPLEFAANAMATVLDKVAEIADGIPVASFVLKGLSFILSTADSLKFDARMNRMIKSLFPDLSPPAWTYVVEEVARRVTVLCAPEIQALHSGTEDRRGRVKNWFRNKCSEYGLATLTSKAEDAVVMMALQQVDCVSQLALSGSIPENLSEVELAEFIVRHVAPPASAPAAAPAQAPATPSVPPSQVSSDRASPPPHDIASHGEVEELRKMYEEQKKAFEDQKKAFEDQKKAMTLLKTKVEKLAPEDNDHGEPGCGGELILAAKTSEVSAESASTAAAQAVRPVQQQVVRVEHQLQELAGFIMSHSDPVLKSHLEDLNNAAVPVSKKHGDVVGWQDRFMAVRRGTLFYAGTYEAVKSLADSRAHSAGDQHVIDLAGCSVTKCPEATDKAHFAFSVTTPQVNKRARVVAADVCWS
jgi:hypothetical protein